MYFVKVHATYVIKSALSFSLSVCLCWGTKGEPTTF